MTGLSGFLADLLWRVYPLFPSQGLFDWILLFLALAFLVQLLVFPYYFRKERNDIKGDLAASSVILLCLITLIWFFSTDAGASFLKDRIFFDIPVSTEDDNVQAISALSAFFICLACFASVSETGAPTNIADKLPASSVFFLFVFLLHLFYWHWNVSSMILMQCFVLSALFFIPLRWFYLHKIAQK